MASNDDKALDLLPTPPKEATVSWLRDQVNSIIKKIYTTLHYLEGRSGPVAIRAATTVAGSLAVGTTYDDTLVKPPNGLIVEGLTGLQTSAPKTDLHIRTTQVDAALPFGGVIVDSNLNTATVVGRRQRGSYTAPSAVQSGDGLARFGGGGYGTLGFSQGPRGYMAAEATENWTDTAHGTKLTFYYTPNGSTTPVLILTLDGDTIATGSAFSSENETNDNLPKTLGRFYRSRADSTPPGAADFGADFDWQLEGFTDGGRVLAAKIRGAWELAQGNNTTDRDSYLGFWTILDNTLTERVRITSGGSLLTAKAGALGTGATDGFLYIPTSAGLPTGTPTTQTGMVPIEHDTTGDRLMAYNNSRWVDVGLRTVKTTGDVTSTSTSFADVTGLSFAVDASKDYIFEFYVVYQTDATTTGIALAVNGPSTPTFINGETRIYRNTTVPVDEMFRAYDTGTPSPGIDMANTNSYAHIRGTFSNGSNAGTLIVRLASEVGGATVTVKAGSSGWIKQI